MSESLYSCLAAMLRVCSFPESTDKLCSPATIDREPTEVLLLSRIGIIIQVPSLVISLYVSLKAQFNIVTYPSVQ